MTDYSKPFRTLERVVPDEWTDYNGHMNEARYLECFSIASDGLFEIIGCDQAYVKAGKSYFTVETHICHLAEAVAGEEIYVTVQVLEGIGKKLRLFQRLFHGGGNMLATGEQLFIHVDLATRRSCEPTGVLADKLAQIVALHSELPLPDQAGKGIGER